MNWSDEKLMELKGFGAAFFNIKKTAVCMQLKYTDLMDELKDVESKAYSAYYGGWFESESKINRSIIEVAINGSSPAQTQALKLMEHSKNENEL
jgi:hypothetical protein